MKNHLILLAFFTLVSLCTSQLGCNNTIPGSYSAGICVSKTQFVFWWEDPAIATPESCPNGTVCADVSKICSSSAKPVCKNTHPNSPGTCNECIDETTNRVCISNTTYSICNQGVVQMNLVYTCPSSTPYCKAVLNTTANETQVIGICTTDPANLDCVRGDSYNSGTDICILLQPATTPRPTTPLPTLPTPYTGNFTCSQAGFFANPSSTNCTSYIKCQPNVAGGYDLLSFSCTGAGAMFDPITAKCTYNYNCPQRTETYKLY